MRITWALTLLLSTALLPETPSTALAHSSSAAAARWDFGAEEATPLRPHGNVQRDQAGPRPPEFPDMPAGNTAVRLDAGGYFSVPDPGPGSVFDFTNGDAITLEAWVNPTTLRDGQPRYVIGKGRTGSPKFTRDNQNWALRIVGARGEAKISFLFATELSSSDQHWHRWTSKLGFPVSTGWHHIAVSYRFGEPASIRGWVNGRPTDGTWDMGGATTESPIVDDDEIRIGTSYEGLLDAIAVHRSFAADETMAARFRRVGDERTVKLQPQVMPDLGEIPQGRVLMQICAGLPAADRWLYEAEQWPAESVRWLGDEFLLPRIPLQYDAWGIRTSWQAPLLLRVAADVELPVGERQFLMRARALGRLWVDGQLVAKTNPITDRPPDGEERILPVADPPLPGSRPPGYRQQEVTGTATIDPPDETAEAEAATRRCRVVLELVVGGEGHRTETGEVCVALLAEDGQSYAVPGPDLRRLPLTDFAVEPALAAIETGLTALDDSRRRAAAASQDGFWKQRHDLARDWVGKHPAPDIPTVETQTKPHPVDAFLLAKIERGLAAGSGAQAEEAVHFHDKVLPILRENCFRCHGERDKGGLRLNTRNAVLKGGESEIPAVVPGDAQASELVTRIRSEDDGLRMPPTDEGLTSGQIELLEQWIEAGAAWPDPPVNASDVALAPAIGDEAFLRRIYLDTIGLPPSPAEAREFLGDARPHKRERLIERLLDDPRAADHWMSFWLDLLAENPSLLNASLNSTGPFRWFVYDSLRDHKPLDRMVTELLLLRGSAAEGGSAGFALAGENDAPLAAKGHVVASALLGIELQCARCHDSPYHSTTQEDLYALAAMFDRKPVTVPATSRVPAAFFEQKGSQVSLIQVTLKPDEPVEPKWPFAEVTGVAEDADLDRLMQQPGDTRERLAALITAPHNQRFSPVIVNRVWKRLMGAGLVEPIDDWEGRTASHPDLLEWLSRELITHDFDLQHVLQLILSSDAYQRTASGSNLAAAPEMRFFNAPDQRRLSAEQIVDSLHQATGRAIDVEELTFVHDGRRPLGSRQTLGEPTRAWMFCDLKNERDRPSLSLPRARAVVDVLEAFGWTGSRQMPISERESDPNVLQPGILANGTLAVLLTRASHGSELAELALAADGPESLVDELFLRVLCRSPRDDERQTFAAALAEGFEKRLVPEDRRPAIVAPPPLPQVTWFNHLRPRANEIQLELERRAHVGRPADPRLQPAWREVYEDMIWSLINHREFVWMP